MKEIKYSTIMRAEQKPDIYGGENCDEHVPEWEIGCTDDKDADYSEEIVLQAKKFMPGTRITVEVPCCPNPECELPCEICECGFDWKAWAEEQYA